MQIAKEMPKPVSQFSVFRDTKYVDKDIVEINANSLNQNEMPKHSLNVFLAMKN